MVVVFITSLIIPTVEYFYRFINLVWHIYNELSHSYPSSIIFPLKLAEELVYALGLQKID